MLYVVSADRAKHFFLFAPGETSKRGQKVLGACTGADDEKVITAQGVSSTEFPRALPAQQPKRSE